MDEMIVPLMPIEDFRQQVIEVFEGKDGVVEVDFNKTRDALRISLKDAEPWIKKEIKTVTQHIGYKIRFRNLD